ncbi:hypothetical protein HK103_006135 [Boothiomyces macroporosus]|uniref:Uncharacterized protein n=1 Tax=Boothiomyces macroporosus TaxID=261099 RepID=A0AAD5UEK4_9FUNG|nr:hypothetical protein HK103_006135 [Boothiomyces macroporosus]
MSSAFFFTSDWDRDAFKGQMPGKTFQQIHITDKDLETVPRAIYNDFVAELKLREEGYSGSSSSDIRPLKYINEPDFLLNLCMYSKSELPKEEPEKLYEQTPSASENNLGPDENSRTVILTDWGIDILNFSLKDAIPPIEKPNITSPQEKPVHIYGKFEAGLDFAVHQRYSTRLNRLAASTPEEIENAYKNCSEMISERDKDTLKNVLKYKRKAVKSEPLARGLSYLGRGRLDVRMGWANMSQFDNQNFVGDISESAVREDLDNQASSTSFAAELAQAPYQAKQALLRKVSRQGTASRSSAASRASVEGTKKPLLKSLEQEAKSTNFQVDMIHQSPTNAMLTPKDINDIKEPSVILETKSELCEKQELHERLFKKISLSKVRTSTSERKSSVKEKVIESEKEEIDAEEEEKWIQSQKDAIFQARVREDPLSVQNVKSEVPVDKSVQTQSKLGKLIENSPELASLMSPKLNAALKKEKQREVSLVANPITPQPQDNPSFLSRFDKILESNSRQIGNEVIAESRFDKFVTTESPEKPADVKNEPALPKRSSTASSGKQSRLEKMLNLNPEPVTEPERETTNNTNEGNAISMEIEQASNTTVDTSTKQSRLEKLINLETEGTYEISASITTAQQCNMQNLESTKEDELVSSSEQTSQLKVDIPEVKNDATISNANDPVLSAKSVTKTETVASSIVLSESSPVSAPPIPPASSKPIRPLDHAPSANNDHLEVNDEGLQNRISSYSTTETISEGKKKGIGGKVKKWASKIAGKHSEGKSEENLSKSSDSLASVDQLKDEEESPKKKKGFMSSIASSLHKSTHSIKETVDETDDQSHAKSTSSHHSLDALNEEGQTKKKKGFMSSFGLSKSKEKLGEGNNRASIIEPISQKQVTEDKLVVENSLEPSNIKQISPSIDSLPGLPPKTTQKVEGLESKPINDLQKETLDTNYTKIEPSATMTGHEQNQRSEISSPVAQSQYMVLPVNNQPISLTRQEDNQTIDADKQVQKQDIMSRFDKVLSEISPVSDSLVVSNVLLPESPVKTDTKTAKNTDLSKPVLQTIEKTPFSSESPKASTIERKVEVKEKLVTNRTEETKEKLSPDSYTISSKIEIPPPLKQDEKLESKPYPKKDIAVVQDTDKSTKIDQPNQVIAEKQPIKGSVDAPVPQKEVPTKEEIAQSSTDAPVPQKEAVTKKEIAQTSISVLDSQKDLPANNQPTKPSADFSFQKEEQAKMETVKPMANVPPLQKEEPVKKQALEMGPDLKLQENIGDKPKSNEMLVRSTDDISRGTPVGKVEMNQKPVKVGPNSKRFLNAMDMAKIESAQKPSELKQSNPDLQSTNTLKSQESLQKPAELQPSPAVVQPTTCENVKKSTDNISKAEPIPSSKSANNLKNQPTDSDSEKWLETLQKVTWKEHKCEVQILKFELHAFEVGKKKETTVVFQCVIPHEDKNGGEFKKIALGFSSSDIAKQWKDHLLNLSFGAELGVYEESTKRGILILAEKSDKDSTKLVEKYMTEVFEASKRPFELKEKQDFKTLGNIVCTNSDFVSRLQQVLVRNQLCNNPVVLMTEKDPVDGALDIVRCK